MANEEERAMTTRARGFTGYSYTWRSVRYLVALTTELMGGRCMPKRGCAKQRSGMTCLGDAVNDAAGSGGRSSAGSEASCCCSMKVAARPYVKLREGEGGPVGVRARSSRREQVGEGAREAVGAEDAISGPVSS
ncbi:hypothetical protein VPH35_123428 [Triticum aestivum]